MKKKEDIMKKIKSDDSERLGEKTRERAERRAERKAERRRDICQLISVCGRKNTDNEAERRK